MNLGELTKREQEVARLLLCAFSNQEIATVLHIHVGTVKQHLRHISLKAGMLNVNRIRLVMALNGD